MIRDRWLRRFAADYAQAFNHLLPQGLAWPRYADTVLQKTVKGITTVWGEDVELLAATLLTIESDPRQTTILLPDWERAWGLPDKCLAEPISIADRRLALVRKMTLLGAQSREFFIGVAASIGYDIKIREFSPFMAGVSHVGDTSALDFINHGNVVSQLLLHFEDVDASTNILDDSGNRNIVRVYGAAQIDTAQKKFGNASLLLDGTNSYLALGTASRASASSCTIAAATTTPTTLTVGGTVTGYFGVGDFVSGTGILSNTKILSQLTGTPGKAGTYEVTRDQTVASPVAILGGSVVSSFDFQTADFTIEMQYRPAATGVAATLYDFASPIQAHLWKKADDKLYLTVGGVDKIIGTTALTTGQFWHIRLVNSATAGVGLFLNGAQQGAFYVGTTSLSAGVDGPYIGALGGTSNFTNGWIDEVQVKKGVADNTTGFTAPIAAYTSYVPPAPVHYRWEIGAPEMRFYWVVSVTSKKLVWFRVTSGQSGIDPHLRIGLATDLECILRKWKPAHTDIVFDYSQVPP